MYDSSSVFVYLCTLISLLFHTWPVLRPSLRCVSLFLPRGIPVQRPIGSLASLTMGWHPLLSDPQRPFYAVREVSLTSQVVISSVLYCAHLCMKCFLGISNFLEEISRLSHSIVFFYFFALITEENFLISPCYSLELCIEMGISFLFSFTFCFSSFQSYL